MGERSGSVVGCLTGGYIEGSRIRHGSTSGDDTSLLRKSFTRFAHLPNEMHSIVFIFTDSV